REGGEVDGFVSAVLRETLAAGETAGRNRNEALSGGGEGAAAKWRSEPELGHVGAERLHPVRRESLRKGVGVVERRAIVENGGPRRRQRGGAKLHLRVGSPHLDRVLEPHLREKRVEMKLPIVKVGPFALEAVVPKRAERLARVRHDSARPLDEEHRHVERP